LDTITVPLCPPLVIKEEQVATALSILEDVLPIIYFLISHSIFMKEIAGFDDIDKPLGILYRHVRSEDKHSIAFKFNETERSR
jgi:hypothetical protein